MSAVLSRQLASLLLLLPVLLCAALGASAPPASNASVPVLVELFTSEGCSSCPPADALLQRMLDQQPAPGIEIVGLSEHVDYWDHQGWKDRFSSSSLTDRQQTYANRFNDESIYTPQMVVDGRAGFVGSDGAAARRAIERAAAVPHGTLTIGVDRPARHVTIAASQLPPIARGDHADVLVAVTEDGLQSDVKRGENHGRVLKHAAVVRLLRIAGELPRADGGVVATTLEIGEGWQPDHLKIVAFVQERRSRAILASAAIPMPHR